MSDAAVATRPRITQVGLLRRCFLILALVPIVPSTSCVAEQFIAAQFPVQDEVWLHQLLFSAILMLALILIIRATVVWSLGRVGLSALISIIPFVQVVFNKPLWDVGCVNDVLQTGQHQFGCGLWIWLSVWVWWGWEKRTMTRNQTSRTRIRTPGAILISALTASIGLIPVVFGTWLILGVYLDNVLGLNNPGILYFCTYGTCALIALVAWWFIWRRLVIVSVRVRWLTVGTWLPLVGVPISLQLLDPGTLSQPWKIILQISPLIGWGIWMGVTGWIWPLRLASSAQVGPHCSQCQYPLTGLTHTRCPECGTQPTLDALWAASCGNFH